MPDRRGAFPDFMIADAMSAGWITGADEKNINPGSFDVALSEEFYRVPGLPFPRPSEKISDLLEKIGATRHDHQYPLECGVTYLVRLRENFPFRNMFMHTRIRSRRPVASV